MTFPFVQNKGINFFLNIFIIHLIMNIVFLPVKSVTFAALTLNPLITSLTRYKKNTGLITNI